MQPKTVSKDVATCNQIEVIAQERSLQLSINQGSEMMSRLLIQVGPKEELSIRKGGCDITLMSRPGKELERKKSVATWN